MMNTSSYIDERSVRSAVILGYFLQQRLEHSRFESRQLVFIKQNFRIPVISFQV